MAARVSTSGSAGDDAMAVPVVAWSARSGRWFVG
jgi:hypothetical protein